MEPNQVGSESETAPAITTADWAVCQYLCSFIVMLFALVLFSFGVIKESPWVTTIGSLYAFISIFGFYSAHRRTMLLAKAYFYILLASMLLVIFAFFSDLTSLASWSYHYCASEGLNDELCSHERWFKWHFSFIAFMVSLLGCWFSIFVASALQNSIDLAKNNPISIRLIERA